MREPERDLWRLQDIIQAANHIASFTDGNSREALRENVEVIKDRWNEYFKK